MKPAQAKVPQHEVQPRNTTPSPHAVQLPLFVYAPHRIYIFNDIRANKLLDQVPDIAEPGSTDHDVGWQLRTILEDYTVLREVRNQGIVLEPDFTVDDELTTAMV